MTQSPKAATEGGARVKGIVYRVAPGAGEVNPPDAQDMIRHRLHRFPDLTDDQIQTLAETLDPDEVEQISDSLLAVVASGTLPGLPLHPNGGYPLGMPGATAATRFVGATVSGAPTTGAFLAGDFVVTHDAHLFVCTVSGSPGTWLDIALADIVANTPDATASVKGLVKLAGDLAGTASAPTVPGLAGKAAALAVAAVKTGSYTAAANEIVPVDTTSGAVTVTLPTAPAEGTRVTVKHVVQGSTNAVTVARGGSSDVFNKAGGSTSLTLTYLNQAVTVQYKASGGIWYVVSDDIPASALTGTSGAALTPTSVKTAAYTAAAGQLVPVDTTSAAVPVTLPTAPADKTQVGVAVLALGTGNAATVVTGGSDVFFKAGGSTTQTVGTLRTLVLQYAATSGIWYAVGGSVPMAVALGGATLDAAGKIPTVQLGRFNGDATKFLNGSGDFAVPTVTLSGSGQIPSVTDAAFAGGADPTGVNDCKAAFDACLAASDVIYIPPGLYNFDAPLASLTKSKYIFGGGYHNTILRTTANFGTNYPDQFLLVAYGTGTQSDSKVAQTSTPLSGSGVLQQHFSGYNPQQNPATPSANGVRFNFVSGTPVGTGTATFTIQLCDDPDFRSGVTDLGTVTFTESEGSTTKAFATNNGALITKQYARVAYAIDGGLTSFPVNITHQGGYVPIQGFGLYDFSINSSSATGIDGDGRWQTQGIFLDRVKWISMAHVWINKQRGNGLKTRALYDSSLLDVKVLKCGWSAGASFLNASAATSIEIVALDYDPNMTGLSAQILAGVSSGFRIQISLAGSVVETSGDLATSAAAGVWGATSAYVRVFDKNSGGAPVVAGSQPIGAPRAAVSLEPSDEFDINGMTNQVTVEQMHLEDNKCIQLYLGRRSRRNRFVGLKCHGDLASNSVMTLFPHIVMESAYTNQFYASSMNRAGATHVYLGQSTREAQDPTLLSTVKYGSDRNVFVACYADSAQTNQTGTATTSGGLGVATPSYDVANGLSNRWVGCTWSSNPKDIQVRTNSRNTDNAFDESCDFHDLWNDGSGTYKGIDITSLLVGPVVGRWRNPSTNKLYWYNGTALTELPSDQTKFASLGVDGKVPSSQLPTSAVSSGAGVLLGVARYWPTSAQTGATTASASLTDVAAAGVTASWGSDPGGTFTSTRLDVAFVVPANRIVDVEFLMPQVKGSLSGTDVRFSVADNTGTILAGQQVTYTVLTGTSPRPIQYRARIDLSLVTSPPAAGDTFTIRPQWLASSGTATVTAGGVNGGILVRVIGGL